MSEREYISWCDSESRWHSCKSGSGLVSSSCTLSLSLEPGRVFLLHYFAFSSRVQGKASTFLSLSAYLQLRFRFWRPLFYLLTPKYYPFWFLHRKFPFSKSKEKGSALLLFHAFLFHKFDLSSALCFCSHCNRGSDYCRGLLTSVKLEEWE